ncbi:RDD family protein [Halobacillus dabanensis]|uniref:RDD family protein n=1 Tax=Halobacillus dabanensis TaxID=240302 RepID=A0A1I3ZPI1_HALDA|nr:RDD family protein [Halobacillus dabanensis]SFK46005.1 RDD family protein [Halobacillus dabanensis]
MDIINKKRMKAICIDFGISTVVTLGVEQLLRKKIKNEAFHALITPTLVMWSLEYAQIRRSNQTVGLKLMGLQVESENGSSIRPKQIIKRMAYRDTILMLNYLKNPKRFEDGTKLPHDQYAGTMIKEQA